jgi:hypothetical protein
LALSGHGLRTLRSAQDDIEAKFIRQDAEIAKLRVALLESQVRSTGGDRRGDTIDLPKPLRSVN